MTYVLPLRWDRPDPPAVAELTGYLRGLARHVEIIVVDGSPPEVYARHHHAWRDLVRHIPPDPAYDFRNGKVNGVCTGVYAARHEHVVVADDDVRHTAGTLAAIHRHLHTASVVRPQNYFDPLPWHAYWDTGRTLLNRCFGTDYPGTLGLRRTPFAEAGGYDGDVLFENLELIRTMRALGGRESAPLDLYVPRLPPDHRKFWSQRVRQAYDEFAQPLRMACFLGVLPAAYRLRHRPGLLAAAAGVVVLLADVGRRRGDGTRVFPAGTPLFAPVWLAERGVCAWLAVGRRLMSGGVPYAGHRLRVAAHPVADLRRRHAGRTVTQSAADRAFAPRRVGNPAGPQWN
jgi:hypothetical protein